MTKKLKPPCKVCHRLVSKKNGFQCLGKCGEWVHFKCMNHPTTGRLKDMRKGVLQVFCPCPDCKPTNKKKEFYIDTTCMKTGCLAMHNPTVCRAGCTRTGKTCGPPGPPAGPNCCTPVYPSPSSPGPKGPSFYIQPEPTTTTAYGWHKPKHTQSTSPNFVHTPCSAPIYPSPCCAAPDPNETPNYPNYSEPPDFPPTFFIRPKPSCESGEYEPNYMPHLKASASFDNCVDESCPNIPSTGRVDSELLIDSPSSQVVEDVRHVVEQLTSQVNTLLKTLQMVKSSRSSPQQKKCKGGSFLCNCKKLICRSS